MGSCLNHAWLRQELAIFFLKLFCFCSRMVDLSSGMKKLHTQPYNAAPRVAMTWKTSAILTSNGRRSRSCDGDLGRATPRSSLVSSRLQDSDSAKAILWYLVALEADFSCFWKPARLRRRPQPAPWSHRPTRCLSSQHAASGTGVKGKVAGQQDDSVIRSRCAWHAPVYAVTCT